MAMSSYPEWSSVLRSPPVSGAGCVWERMRIRRLAVLLALVLAAPAAADTVPKGYTYQDEWLTSFDGTQLHAGVFLPPGHKPGDKHPVLMVPGPYGSPNGASEEPGNLSGPNIR